MTRIKDGNRYRRRPDNPDALHLYCVAQRRETTIILVVSKPKAEEALRVVNAAGYPEADWALATTATRRINRNVEGPERVIAELRCLKFSPADYYIIGGED